MSRATIGRQLNSQAIAEQSSSASRTQYFTLKTGRKVKFTFVTVPAADVSAKTFVRQDTNGRDQAALTKESLKDIIRTITFQQFFACIGVKDNEQVEILDGSRRRAAAIFAHVPLEIMVTSEKLSFEEARQLAKDIQTAREHNLREIGLRLLKQKEAGLNQKQIAEQEGLSQAKVTRALQAASVSQALVALFPVQAELSYTDFKVLLDVEESLDASGVTVQLLLDEIAHSLEEILSDESIASDDKKNSVMKLVIKGSRTVVEEPEKEKPVVAALWKFEEKDRFARKRIKGRTFSYEFSRLSKEVQSDIDRAIEDILKKHHQS